MSCLETLLSIRGVCDHTTSLSGLDLMDAPELSPNGLAQVTNEEFVSWKELVKNKYNQAITLVKNDVIHALSANNAMGNVTQVKHLTGVFKTASTYPAEDKDRGIILYRNPKIKGELRKTVIHNIKVYPLADLENATVKIITDYPGDGVGTEYTYSHDMIANQVNTLNVEFTIPAPATYARVVINGSELPVASAYLTCFTGCNGTMPNDCGYTKGYYNGNSISSKEGFGIVLEFSCVCDYGELLCDMANSVLGEIVYLKSRVLLLEEHLKSNRLTNYVIYNREETKGYLNDVENQYRSKWNDLMSTLPNILRQYRDDCIICRGTQWVTNI